eukprot:m.191116 g.191116  ORF g.191116 m.191116 type:complete len:382 (+) comp24911_c0_seq1:54-1199(+)
MESQLLGFGVGAKERLEVLGRGGGRGGLMCGVSLLHLLLGGADEQHWGHCGDGLGSGCTCRSHRYRTMHGLHWLHWRHTVLHRLHRCHALLHPLHRRHALLHWLHRCYAMLHRHCHGERHLHRRVALHDRIHAVHVDRHGIHPDVWVDNVLHDGHASVHPLMPHHVAHLWVHHGGSEEGVGWRWLVGAPLLPPLLRRHRLVLSLHVGGPAPKRNIALFLQNVKSSCHISRLVGERERSGCLCKGAESAGFVPRVARVRVANLSQGPVAPLPPFYVDELASTATLHLATRLIHPVRVLPPLQRRLEHSHLLCFSFSRVPVVDPPRDLTAVAHIKTPHQRQLLPHAGVLLDPVYTFVHYIVASGHLAENDPLHDRPLVSDGGV